MLAKERIEHLPRLVPQDLHILCAKPHNVSVRNELKVRMGVGGASVTMCGADAGPVQSWIACGRVVDLRVF